MGATVVFLVGLVCCLMTSTSALNNASSTPQHPDSVEFTLNSKEFVIGPDDRMQWLMLKDEKVIIEHGDYQLSSDNKTAHIFYPLSHSFRTCRHKKVLDLGTYEGPKADRSISHVHTGQSWPLGEYYTVKNGSAVVCLHCTYLKLKRDEYDYDNTTDTFHLHAANKSFHSPDYIIENATQMANVCYPIVTSKKCTWVMLDKWNTVFDDTHKSVFDKETSTTYELGEYILTSDNGVAICITPHVPDEMDLHKNKICTIITIISAACLAVAVVVHLVVTDLSFQRVPLVCHAFSLMVTYICLALRNLGFDLIGSDSTWCYPVFYITYIAGVASFAWLTVLAFDTWRITAHLRNGGKGYVWADRFCSSKSALYSIFGWGLPIAFACFVVGLDYSSEFQDWIGLHPRLQGMTWFNEMRSCLTLWYAPMGVLLGINFIFFLLSLINLCLPNRDSGPFSNVKISQQLLVVLLVVFLAMGVFWVLEIASYLDFGNYKVWYFADFVNAFQGVIIALVYTCSPLTWKAHSNKKYKNFDGYD